MSELLAAESNWNTSHASSQCCPTLHVLADARHAMGPAFVPYTEVVTHWLGTAPHQSGKRKRHLSVWAPTAAPRDRVGKGSQPEMMLFHLPPSSSHDFKVPSWGGGREGKVGSTPSRFEDSENSRHTAACQSRLYFKQSRLRLKSLLLYYF